MSSNSVCNHTRDEQIGLPLRGRPFLPAFLVFHRTAVDRACLLFTMFTGVQHVSTLIEMDFYLLLNSVRLELRSASESIQPD